MSKNYLHPEPEQLAAFTALPQDEPFEVLNLIRFRLQAAYPNYHTAAREDLTGVQAFARYSAAAQPLFAQAGGRVVWMSAPTAVLIGPPDDAWDTAFVVTYRDAAAFLALTKDPAYLKAAEHRDAAVLSQLAVRCAPRTSGESFG